MKLGPEGYDKIAICGSAPSSSLLAPFEDKSWAIWGTSPSEWAQLAGRRTDVWFEVHRYIPYPPAQVGRPGTKSWFSPEFHQFLKDHPCVFMTDPHPDIKNAHRYPFEEMLRKYGPYHFSSSVSWMLALAIETLAPMVEEGKHPTLALFGIDMAAQSEWSYQRPACQHFLGMAKMMGIQVVIPPESDLMQHNFIYGLGEHNPRYIKLSARKEELEGQKTQLEQGIQQAQLNLQRVLGSLDQLEYFLETWSDDIVPEITDAMSFSGRYLDKPLGGAVVDEND